MDDFDYKDIYDFDFSEIDNWYDENINDEMTDSEILGKDLKPEDEKKFKNKVKKYIKDKAENWHGFGIDVPEKVGSYYVLLDELEHLESFGDALLIKFNGNRELFYKYADEVIHELADNYFMKFVREYTANGSFNRLKGNKDDIKRAINICMDRNIAIPTNVKIMCNKKGINYDRIIQEVNLERLQEEDQKCDEALALVEELDKEQEGQTQGKE